MRADALRDYGAWRGLVAEAVRLGIDSGRFATQSTPERIAVLTIALVDGVGIPRSDRGCLSALDQLLRPQAAAPGAMDRAQRL